MTKLTDEISERLSTNMRLYFNLYIRPLYIKNHCSVCECKEELELHHDDLHFSQILNEALKLLNLNYRTYIGDYSENELELLKYVITGMHIHVKYKTLCKKCHMELHKEEGVDRTNYYTVLEINRLKKEKDRLNHVEDKLIPYLESNIGKTFLTRVDREDLISLIDVRDVKNNRQIKGKNTLNKYISQFGYYLKEFSTSRSSNGMKKTYKNAWRIEKVMHNSETSD